MAVGLVAAVGTPGASAQFGFERIPTYDVTVDVAKDGSLAVVETIDYDFGTADVKHGIFRDIPVQFHYDKRYDRVTPVDQVHVTGSPGTPVDTKVSRQGNNLHIRIGDPDKTVTGPHRYEIAYRVR